MSDVLDDDFKALSIGDERLFRSLLALGTLSEVFDAHECEDRLARWKVKIR